MTLPSLAPLLEVRGVQGAALVGANGQVGAAVGDSTIDPGLVGAARAVIQSLQAATDAKTWNDLLLDLENGPLLLTPYGDSVLAVHFDEVPALGRVRLGVRRVLS
ncbi:roadblock/LC7 domain-containing protein [Deinococcus sp. VB343]|uniref:Roadblock/LC7 domain-containing protein n=1 Tax=Deinococcus sp. VB142 TaxID=3112952 RepID=A0AAU6Q4B7_9DEIO